MRIIGWNLGQRGDIVMNTVVARGFKEEYPDSHVTLGIYKAYSDMADLFKHHPYIDDVHIYDSYEDWPNEIDSDFLKNAKFDKVFHGMPSHSSYDWYNMCTSQTEEACKMNNVKVPNNLQCYLNKWFETLSGYENTICIAPFSDSVNKDLSKQNAQTIVDELIKNGFDVVQLSGPNQSRLKGAHFSDKNYFENVKILLSSKALISINTGMSWVSSAYSHKTLGLYGLDDWGYHGIQSSSIYEPINPNAIYLRAKHANHISIKSIIENLNYILSIPYADSNTTT